MLKFKEKIKSYFAEMKETELTNVYSSYCGFCMYLASKGEVCRSNKKIYENIINKYIKILPKFNCKIENININKTVHNIVEECLLRELATRYLRCVGGYEDIRDAALYLKYREKELEKEKCFIDDYIQIGYNMAIEELEKFLYEQKTKINV